MELITKILENKTEILQIIAQMIALATIIVKLTPTMKDDNILLPIVKFVGKYVALNKSVKDRPE